MAMMEAPPQTAPTVPAGNPHDTALCHRSLNEQEYVHYPTNDATFTYSVTLYS